MTSARSGLCLRASLRYPARHPWHLLVTVLGVALGVAVTVALDLAIQSSRQAFQISQETLTGRTSHQVRGGATGLPDALPAQLRIEVGVPAVAPVVEGFAVHPDHPGRALHLLGVDPFSEAPFRPFLSGDPGGTAGRAQEEGGGGALEFTRLLVERGATLLSRETAEALAVRPGEPFLLRVGGQTVQVNAIGVLEAADDWSRQGLRDVLVVDIAEAQTLLGRAARIDRIDLILPEGPEEEVFLARIREILPPGASVEPAGARTRAMQDMVRAFDLNLTALSLLGLVFAAFLIYNAMTFSVIQRRRLFGTLRALGATRGEILKGVLLEAGLLGLGGSFLGVLLGIVLGRGLVRLVTRTLNDLYFAVSVEGVALPPEVLIRGGLVGVGVTLLASLPPAWEATTVSAREALARSTVESRVRRLVPWVGVAGVAGLGVGGLLLGLTERSLAGAFAGLSAILLGMAFLVPVSTIALVGLLRPLLRRVLGVIGAMAARGVVTSLSRTAPAMASLAVAVAVSVGLGIMIQSFRASVVDWLEVTLQADLYISPPSVVSARAEGALPAPFIEAARALPGVAGVSTYRGTEFLSGYGWTRLVALDLHPRGRDALQFLEGDREAALAGFVAGEGVLLSEPFAFRHRLSVGDSVTLPSDLGEWALPVLGVFRDYGSDLGTVMIGRAAYDRGWTDPAVTSLGIFLDPGVAPASVAEALRVAAGADAPLSIRENAELRALSLEVFDRTFEVTRVLRLLAFIVAFISVLSALMALQLERVRELGVLRANGMTPGQTWGLISVQTSLMGWVAGLLALPMGFVLAGVMILVVNRRSFGWTLDVHVSPGLLAQAVLLAWAGAILAGLYPAWKMSRTSPAEALAER
jgi:putative ABC transport system permease protein